MVKSMFHFVLALVVAVGSLIPSQDFSRLPNLLAHYSQHVEKNGSLSFFDFIQLHYGQQATQHDHEEHHEHLPFKSLHAPSFLVFYIPCGVQVARASAKPITDLHTFFNTPVLVIERIASIWQPPKGNE